MKNGNTVYWVWQDGKPAAETKFTETTIPAQLTPEFMIARYGDPRVAAGKPDLPMSSFRFPVDPVKGSLPGVILTAIRKGNSYGIREQSNAVAAYVQAMDVAATLAPQGESSPIYREFPPDTSGFSTDRNNPTRVSLPNPPFGVAGFQFGGKTFWLNNVWPEPVEVEPKPAALPTVNKSDELDEIAEDLESALERADKVSIPSTGGGSPARALRDLKTAVRKVLERIG